MHVCTIVGARPQFIKAAVVSQAMADAGIQETLIHTGQHYDGRMSGVFFEELAIATPTVNLGVGSGPHGAQTGAMMARLEAYLLEYPLPDAILVYGDTNSTLAGALVAAKLHVPLAHAEAGLRSFNRRMPEEVNRMVADRLADLLFCPSLSAAENLRAESITQGVHVTGDVMLDALRHYLPFARERCPLNGLIPFEPGGYLLLTLHRAENTDDPGRLHRLLDVVRGLDRPVVWPMHPRTRERLAAFGLRVPQTVHVVEPVGYLASLRLLDSAAAVLTDSGGMQKEAYWLGKPCLTLRAETEWVETLGDGWNTLVDDDPERVHTALAKSPSGDPQPYYGDGQAAGRIARLLLEESL